MSQPDHSVTILVNGTVTIWLSHQHSDLLINQDVMIQKGSTALACNFLKERIGGLITSQPTMMIRV